VNAISEVYAPVRLPLSCYWPRQSRQPLGLPKSKPSAPEPIVRNDRF
jgi:hypothetical protein